MTSRYQTEIVTMGDLVPPGDVNIECLYYVHCSVIPVALGFLPARMNSIEARAMLLAIGMQESRFDHRRQLGGPATGYWQFERGGGVRGVMTHSSASIYLPAIFKTLNYPLTTAGAVEDRAIHDALADNDILACIFARLLLWTVPGSLPQSNQSSKGWDQYLEGWRPGKPHSRTWPSFFAEAWRTVVKE
jgi:hypothetical protein